MNVDRLQIPLDPRSNPRRGGGQAQPPWDPKGRVAVVWNEAVWPATVRAYDAPGRRIEVVIDNGVRRWFPWREVFSLRHAGEFLTGRVMGFSLKADALAKMGRRREADETNRYALRMQYDLITLKRG